MWHRGQQVLTGIVAGTVVTEVPDTVSAVVQQIFTCCPVALINGIEWLKVTSCQNNITRHGIVLFRILLNRMTTTHIHAYVQPFLDICRGIYSESIALETRLDISPLIIEIACRNEIETRLGSTAHIEVVLLEVSLLVQSILPTVVP